MAALDNYGVPDIAGANILLLEKCQPLGRVIGSFLSNTLGCRITAPNTSGQISAKLLAAEVQQHVTQQRGRIDVAITSCNLAGNLNGGACACNGACAFEELWQGDAFQALGSSTPIIVTTRNPGSIEEVLAKPPRINWAHGKPVSRMPHTATSILEKPFDVIQLSQAIASALRKEARSQVTTLQPLSARHL